MPSNNVWNQTTATNLKQQFLNPLPPIEHPKDSAVFLSRNENVKKFGSFDSGGDFFEINTIKDWSVVIEVNNVAHNSKNGESQNRWLPI